MIYHNTVCSFHDPYAILFLWEHMNVRFRSRLFPSLESYELEYWRFEAILFYVTSVWWLTKELDDLKYLCFSSLYSIITCLFLNYTTIFDYTQKMKVIEKKNRHKLSILSKSFDINSHSNWQIPCTYIFGCLYLTYSL